MRTFRQVTATKEVTEEHRVLTCDACGREESQPPGVFVLWWEATGPDRRDPDWENKKASVKDICPACMGQLLKAKV